MDEIINYAGTLTNKATDSIYTSLAMETMEDKKIAYKAMSNPDKKIAEMINLNIKMVNLFCETVELTNKNTGEVQTAPRIVIIDDKGISYQSVSFSIFKAISRIVSVFGPAPWNPPIEVQVKEIGEGAKRLYTLNII